MPGRAVGSVLVVVVLLLAGAAPAGETRERCETCSMYLDIYEKWAAGIEFDDGVKLRFCCTKCMFRHYLGLDEERKEQIRQIVVSQHRSGKKLDAREAFFVVDSDRLGPMGMSMHAFRSRGAAEKFIRKHGGSMVEFDQVDRELVGRLCQ